MIIYMCFPDTFFEIAELQSLIFSSDFQARWQVSNGSTMGVPLNEWTSKSGDYAHSCEKWERSQMWQIEDEI